jgi:hypothetical protein
MRTKILTYFEAMSVHSSRKREAELACYSRSNRVFMVLVRNKCPRRIPGLPRSNGTRPGVRSDDASGPSTTIIDTDSPSHHYYSRATMAKPEHTESPPRDDPVMTLHWLQSLVDRSGSTLAAWFLRRRKDVLRANSVAFHDILVALHSDNYFAVHCSVVQFQDRSPDLEHLVRCCMTDRKPLIPTDTHSLPSDI